MDGRAVVSAQLRARLPILTWLPAYRRGSLRADLLAGAVVAALIVPQALGYAGIAGVPVQVGLYAIPLALVAYAVFGSSRQLVVGPVSTVSVLSGSIVATQAQHDPALAVSLTAALALSAGVALIVAGLLGLGWLAEFLSKPIVTGFVFGLTVVIVVGELPSLLGVPAVSGDVFQKLLGIARELDDVDPLTVLVSVVALVVLFGGTWLAPRVPWGLLVLGLGIAVSETMDLAARGVAVVGPVPEGLPSLGLPGIPIDLVPEVLFGGLTLALVGLAEGLSAARLFAQSGGYTVDADQELVASGAANLGAGLSGGLGVAGSLSKTAAVDRAGGHSQVVGLATALLVVVVLVAFVGSIGPLPRAVLSAIVVHAVWGLMDVRSLQRYRRVRRNDFVAAMSALAGVLVLGTLYGLLAAIGQSVLGLVYRSSKVNAEVMGRIHGEKAAWGSVTQHPERHPVDGVLVLRLDAPIFWVNASDVRTRILAEVDAHPEATVLILDLESTSQLDTSSADMLDALLVDVRARGLDLHLVRVFHFARQVLQRSGFEERLGPDHIWHSISQGVRAARAESDLEAGERAGSTTGALPDEDLAESIAVHHPLEAVVAPDEVEPSDLHPTKQHKHRKHDKDKGPRSHGT